MAPCRQGRLDTHADALGEVLEKLDETLATKEWVGRNSLSSNSIC
jgi:hypothetical protein